ncbi:hypothetical protein FRC01_010834, partial [Tulasnella sp. 417]
WATIRPQLEVLVNQAKQRRLLNQHGNLTSHRQGLVRARIQSYLDQRPLLEAAFRSTVQVVLTTFSAFTDIIDQPSEAWIQAEDFDPAMEALPTLWKEYTDQRKRLLVQRMVEGGAQN